MLRVALLHVSLVAALALPPSVVIAAPGDPLAPAVQRPGGAAPASEPEVQRPGAVDPLASGTGELAPGTAAAPTSSVAPAASPVAAPVAAPVATTPRPGTSRRPPVRATEGVYEVQAGVAKAGDGVPRYFRAPFNESMWPAVMGQEMLMVLGSGQRECVTVTKKTPDALFYVNRSNSKQQAPLVSVTSLHQNSWECKAHDSTPSEWARSGAAVGIGLSGLGLVMGALYDAGHPDPKCERSEVTGAVCAKGGPEMPHFVYSVVGVTTTTLGTPVVAIGGRSTSRDLRVQGKIWARALGWTFYSAATLVNILWLTGFYGDVKSLQLRGLTTSAGVLGLAGAGFMAVDALTARQELTRLRLEDSRRQDRPTAGRGLRGGLRLGASPIGSHGVMSGMSLGLGGRF